MAETTENFRQKVKDLIEDLPEEKVRFVLAFVEFIRDKESWEATKEILASDEMMADIKEADDALQRGESEKFVSWEKTRENV